jgi:hypothetical protein
MNQQVQGAGRRAHGKFTLLSTPRIRGAIPYCRFMNRASKLLLLLLVCLALLAASGCSTTKRLFSSNSSGLKKRVFVLPFWDQAGLGEAKTERLTDQFLSLLNKDGAFVFEKSRKYSTASDKARSPEFGIVADPEEARRAYEMGMNVMLTGVFSPMETQRIKTGIWPFRKIKDETEISMYANAFDVTNGTLLLTRLESVKIRTEAEIITEDDEEPAEPQNIKPEIDEETLEKSFAEIVDRQAAEVRSALNEKPWLGRILSSDASGIFINAGTDVGVVPGSVFEVLGPGETIKAITGQSLALLGPKVGEIKVTEVMKNWALTSAEEGASFRAGQIIRFKK